MLQQKRRTAKQTACSRCKQVGAPVNMQNHKTANGGERQMEFNILNHFKGLDEMPTDPLKADEIGTSLFMTGNMGPQISKKMDEKAKAAGMSRRNFIKSSLGFSAAMLAANEVTGKKFFEVNAAEAADFDAKKEAIHLARASSDFIVDVHTHVCTRPGHYQLGVNTSERGERLTAAARITPWLSSAHFRGSNGCALLKRDGDGR